MKNEKKGFKFGQESVRTTLVQSPLADLHTNFLWLTGRKGKEKDGMRGQRNCDWLRPSTRLITSQGERGMTVAQIFRLFFWERKMTNHVRHFLFNNANERERHPNSNLLTHRSLLSVFSSRVWIPKCCKCTVVWFQALFTWDWDGNVHSILCHW